MSPNYADSEYVKNFEICLGKLPLALCKIVILTVMVCCAANYRFAVSLLQIRVVAMSSAGCFSDFIQARNAAGLQVYMTNERHLPADHLERNNRALFDACRDGANEICEVLISFGADVHSAVVNQRSPLFIACRNAHPACADLLLAHGVNVNAMDLSDDWSPLLATAFEDNTPFGLTLDQFIDNRCRCMRSLLAAGVSIDQIDNNGGTALMDATWNFRLMEILVEAGANVNKLDGYRESVLHWASRRNNVDVAELLMERGADIDAVDNDVQTPLHWACERLKPAIIESLFRHNADIDIVDNGGHTALQLALSKPPTSPNRMDVLQLMATCAMTRLEASSADWIRLGRNKDVSTV